MSYPLEHHWRLTPQLSRLLTQLQDCEDLKEDLDPDEYEETRADTLQQLREFQATLNKMTSGDNTLVSELGSVQLVRKSFIFNICGISMNF